MMLARMWRAATLAAVVLTMPALGAAQQAGSDQYRDVEDDRLLVEPFNLTIGQIDHMDVVGATGERIGEVDGVLMDASGRLAAMRVEVGDSKAAVGLDQLRVEGPRLVTSLTKAEVEALGIPDPDDDGQADAGDDESDDEAEDD
jgi:PRC-barrel domain